MRRVVQSRTGEEGTCFRACLASLLNLPESQIPDFPDANEDPYVNTFLAKHGLHYEEIPYDAANPPVGLYLLLGISPRGGMHVVIEKDGKLVWDTHPQDSTGRGIVEPLKYGVLTRVGRARAKDELIWGPFYSKAEADRLLTGLRRSKKGKEYWQTRVSQYGKLPTPEQEKRGVSIGDPELVTGWGVFGERHGIKDALARHIAQAKDMGHYKYGMGKHCHLCGTPVNNGQKVNECQACRLEKHYEGRLTPRIKADAERIRRALQKASGAKDAASLSGKRLNAAAETLRTKHDEIVSSHLRSAGSSAETAYNALYKPTASLVRDAEVLLTKTRLDDDPAYWHRKLDLARDHLDEAARLAKSYKWSTATSYLDAALTLAHMVIDKMRNSGRGRDYSDRAQKFLREARWHWQMRSYGDCIDDCQDAIAAGADGEGLREVKQYLEACKRKAAVKATDSRRSRLHRALDAMLDGAEEFPHKANCPANNGDACRCGATSAAIENLRGKAKDAVMDGARGMTSTELRDEIRSVKSLISGAAGITLKRTDPNRYAALEHRLDELLDAASYRTK